MYLAFLLCMTNINIIHADKAKIIICFLLIYCALLSCAGHFAICESVDNLRPSHQIHFVTLHYFPSKCCSYINIQEYNSTLEETKTLINPPIAAQATPSSDVVGSDCISVKLLHSRNTCVLQTNLISFQIYVVSVHILPFFVVIEFPEFTFVPGYQ